MDVPDHRRLGRRLDIFATQPECGAGLPFWLPAGEIVRAQLRDYIVALERRHGYEHVSTPVLARRELYERSGHWSHYHDDMYPPMEVGSEQVVLRPMLCPHHILLYGRRPRHLNGLPVRIAEVGAMFRRERSGVVGGLSRVRQMTLNDGHVFCPPGAVADEIVDVLAMVREAYGALHIPPPRLRLSRAGAGPKYVSDPAMWRRGEAIIREALRRAGALYEEAEGEAAFYGPKIDLQVTDPHGREETLSTIQVDLELPRRFDLRYDGPDGRQRPVIVHRSVIATLERMTAHLLEVHDGALPPWLSPTQVRVLAVASDSRGYADEVADRLRGADLRADVDDRDATLGARVRDARERRIPYLAIVGPREDEARTVALALRDGRRVEAVALERFVAMVRGVVQTRAAELLPAEIS